MAKYNAYRDMVMLGKEAAKGVRVNNDKIHNRTHMTYDEFCDAVDKEIPKALFHINGYGQPTMPVGLMAKVSVKLFHADDPDHNYYDDFINLLFE